MTNEEFILELHKIGVIKFGAFTLKSGLLSPYYIDLREMISYPKLLEGISKRLSEKVQELDFDVVTGIPYTALPLAVLVASQLGKPLIFMRKEEKAYGTRKMLIGRPNPGAGCVVIDDLITTGESKIEIAEALEKEGVVVKDFVVVIDRSSGGRDDLKKNGYDLHSLMTIEEIGSVLLKHNLITEEKKREVDEFTHAVSEKTGPKKGIYSANPLTNQLVDLIWKKKSNLILSLDVEDQADFFQILEETAEEIVVLKTHLDIMADFDDTVIPRLQEYAERYHFMILEDRKFADIGNTVRKQYRSGIYKISQWAEFVTVHPIAGDGILQGLFEGISNRSSFLLARMSSRHNLITAGYTRQVLEIGKNHPEVVSGFIGHGKDAADIRRFKNKFPPGFLLLMPGVKLEKGSDSLKQQYITVEEAVRGGADCIIVGRGVYGSDSPGENAKIYRRRAWKEYEKINLKFHQGIYRAKR